MASTNGSEWTGGDSPTSFACAMTVRWGFAGLWESWEGADHSAIESCTILTTGANDLVRPIHDRMPVIVAPADYDRWLDPTTKGNELSSLLRAYPSEPMEAYPVDTVVNSPARDDPRCIEPAAGS